MPGPYELIIILLIVVLLFGARKLPQLGESLGKGIRYFKNALTGKEELGSAGEEEHEKLDGSTSGRGA